MNITISIDETQFKEILDKELKELPKEDLQDIIKQTFSQYMLSNPNIIKNLFVNESSYPYYTCSPTDLMKDIIKGIDLSKECEEVVKALKEELIGHSREIFESLMLKAMAKTMFNGMSDYGWLEEEFVHMHMKAHSNNG